MAKFDWQKFWEGFLNNIGLIMLASFLLLLIFTMILPRENNSTITFNITGETNNLESNNTIISLGLECIKLCNNKFYDTSQKLSMCYAQCQDLLKCGG